jgi:hypothetical protein
MQKPMDYAQIDCMLQEALCQVAKKHPNYGYPGKGNRNSQGETEFQKALHDHLKESHTASGWTWEREVKFSTQSLRNRRGISVDIVGVKDGIGVLVELKYVAKSSTNNKPGDVYAFPYDVLKDCLKSELIISRNAKLRFDNKKPSIDQNVNWVYGLSIGLTNNSQYWMGQDGAGQNGWSRESSKVISNPVGKFNLPRLIRTKEGNAIEKQGRFNLSLGLPWEAEWHEYGCEVEGFRYLYVRPNVEQELKYTHRIEKDAKYFVPFMEFSTAMEPSLNIKVTT